ncbi:hypothetical protein [Sinomonas sp. ASV322]|uniref:hypothetical protein n=1 Tax=Sinomonas sp. ASV322 TaxID=3041920 RepID=UPI0027DE738F|nr:hypothetical protein [Sinomonas sp. ASV322]MDQ4503806.1 hypothetical protein [Sinomonas sp. ASV322]
MPGAEVEARIGDVVHFRGRVVVLHEPMQLFWAVDPIGERRIIDFHEFAVRIVTEVESAEGAA